MARFIASFSAGSMVIYAFGAAWLVFVYKVQPAHAVSIGVLPFIAGDIAKILLAAAVSSAIVRRANTVFSA
jgi:biotin transport system substrate-specific component